MNYESGIPVWVGIENVNCVPLVCEPSTEFSIANISVKSRYQLNEEIAYECPPKYMRKATCEIFNDTVAKWSYKGKCEG